MGRPPWTTRLTVEDCLRLDAAESRRAGVFRSPFGSRFVCHQFSSTFELQRSVGYTVIELPRVAMGLRFEFVTLDPQSGIKTMRRYCIEVTSSPCRFGGRRFWFRCPLGRDGFPCGKRVRCLYLPPGEQVLGCRECYDLTYTSSQAEDKRVYELARTPELIERALRYRDFRWQLAASRAHTLLLRRAYRKWKNKRPPLSLKTLL
jgi:hypothetical protein